LGYISLDFQAFKKLNISQEAPTSATCSHKNNHKTTTILCQ